MSIEQSDDVFAARGEEIDQDAETESLMELAARVEQTLRPVSPEPAFRARLRDGLALAAHHQQAHRMLVVRRSEPPWGWLIGAAAIGSAAGLIAVLLRSRAHSPKTVAPHVQQ
jgi:hypothetical protein